MHLSNVKRKTYRVRGGGAGKVGNNKKVRERDRERFVNVGERQNKKNHKQTQNEIKHENAKREKERI